MEELAKQFYMDGCIINQWKKTPLYDRFMSTLKEIYDEKLRDGFQLKQKYPHSFDIRPQAFEYDSSIIDILFENDVHKILRDAIGSSAILTHVQIRNAFSYPEKGHSYQMWHRDSYVYGDKGYGNLPPGYKIIFYPSFENPSEPVLSVVKGSHIKMMENQEKDWEVDRNKLHTLNNNNDDFLFFDVSLQHSTEHVKTKNQRIIYNFNHRCFAHRYEDAKKCQEMWNEGCIKYA